MALHAFKFPDHLSPLAANLFHRLTKFNSKSRYTAQEALSHPWITRLNKTLIPMTLQDKIENMQTEHNFRSKIRMMLFLSYVSHSENYFENDGFAAYKKLQQKVSNKIDKWYDKRQEDENCRNERFSRDEDYVELAESPSKFDSTDQEEDGEEEDTATAAGEGIVKLAKMAEEDGTCSSNQVDYSKQNFLFGMSPQKSTTGGAGKGASALQAAERGFNNRIMPHAMQK